jgi:hypothetical protein
LYGILEDNNFYIKKLGIKEAKIARNDLWMHGPVSNLGFCCGRNSQDNCQRKSFLIG